MSLTVDMTGPKKVHSVKFQSSQETMGYVSPLHPLLINDLTVLFKMAGVETLKQLVKFSIR